MAHAILRGANGRRHEVDFGDAELTIEVYAGEATIEIVIEAPNDLSPASALLFSTCHASNFLQPSDKPPRGSVPIRQG